MSGGPRSLPPRPNLRYLKLEAKRRLAAGEFPALHDAQVAIAWEHGLPSWAELKRLTSAQPGPASHALAQLHWMRRRFRDAGQPGWTAPGDDEMRQHFTEGMLAVIPAAQLTEMISRGTLDLRQDLVVVGQQQQAVRVRLDVLELVAAAEADPPHRLAMLRAAPYSGPVHDPRVADPPAGRAAGRPPAAVAGLADRVLAEHGLPGLGLAGATPGSPPWVLTRGWADLDRDEELDPGHRFPAYCASALVTATAVLRLVASGRFGLDTPANQQLRTVRLADDSITVRELLSHTAGVDNPDPTRLLADSVPDLVSVTGPVVGCTGPRGVIRPSNGGYAVLGQLIADVTAAPYPDAVTRLVLGPLRLATAAFPARQADLGPGAVTGYTVLGGSAFAPVPAAICTLPSVGGLWATAADIVRLATGWARLLPVELAREALTPQTEPAPGAGLQAGLGWLIRLSDDVAVHGGASQVAGTVLLARGEQVVVALANRLAAVEPVADLVLNATR